MQAFFVRVFWVFFVFVSVFVFFNLPRENLSEIENEKTLLTSSMPWDKPKISSGSTKSIILLTKWWEQQTGINETQQPFLWRTLMTASPPEQPGFAAGAARVFLWTPQSGPDLLISDVLPQQPNKAFQPLLSVSINSNKGTSLRRESRQKLKQITVSS